MRVLVVDANGYGSGRRVSTLDVIGVGPRLVVSLLQLLNADQVELVTADKIIETRCKYCVDFDTIAISFMTSDKEAVRRIVKLWKKSSGKKRFVLLGGPGALDYEFLQELDYDVAVLGEAEIPLMNIKANYGSLETFLDVVHQMSNSTKISIPRGVIVKHINEVNAKHEIAPWTPKNLLDEIVPDIGSVKSYDFYWARRVYVEVVRGCSNFYRPFYTPNRGECPRCMLCRRAPLENRLNCPWNTPPGCGYCSVPLIHGPARSISIHRLVYEIKRLIDLGVTRIVLSAPNFLDYGRDEFVASKPLTDPRAPPPNIHRIKELFEAIYGISEVADGLVSISVENVEACLVNDDVADLLSEYLKGTVIYVGIESGSDRLLDAIGRPCLFHESIESIKKLIDRGIRVYAYLLHGLPGERPEDIEETVKAVDILRSIGVERIVLYRFTPLPRTAFENASRPSAAVKDPIRRILYEKVKEFNTKSKYRILGRVLKAVVASRYRGFRQLIAYPLTHGPVVMVEGSEKLIGAVVMVKIVDVISDRLVRGEIVSVLRRVINVK